MTKEEIIYVKLTPSPGMLLTDGNDITTYVCAPKGKEDDWYEIPDSDSDEEDLKDE